MRDDEEAPEGGHAPQLEEPGTKAVDPAELDPEGRARRRLLRLTAYVAPAVIGTLLIGRDVLAQTPSCSPKTCSPSSCGPLQGCGPQTCKPRR